MLLPAAYLSNAQGADTCARDLEDIAAFLPVNDSGADAALRLHGGAIEAGLQSARKQAAGADSAACDAILRDYLKAWRPGHLMLGPWPWTMEAALSSQGQSQRGPDPFVSKIRVLSKSTVLLTFPTFYNTYEGDIRQLLQKNRPVLERHPNWIVDVRRNNGGSDSSYGPLLPWLMHGGYVNQNVEWLATADNLHAQESICSMAGGQASCEQLTAPVVAALRGTPSGTFALAQGTQARTYVPVHPEKRAPQRVAVLIDRMCGSSCEQFLLAVRQSAKVKLLGRPSSGELDVSNLRPHPLPSGQRAIFYATSRSLRAPDMPIDQIGVQPDILLPRPQDANAEDDEIRGVQRWLEGGALQ